MNTVGPYHNRQETYKYFTLPFCKGPKQEISHHHETMGEALQGVELEFSGLDIGFKGQHLRARIRCFFYSDSEFYWEGPGIFHMTHRTISPNTHTHTRTRTHTHARTKIAG